MTNAQQQQKALKKQESLGEKLMTLWAQIIEECPRNNEIINETFRGAITFAS